MKQPDVSVVIGAYNAMPYLTRTLTSVVEQTLERDRLEVVVVDDGSTDGTGKEIERYAEEHPALFRLVHQDNSGGPAKPRNVGVDLARGRYVFFLDADDYLGPEALERMVAMADKHGSDVVLGKMVGVGGRGAPRSMFTHDQPDVDLYASTVYRTLNPMKLFRRELLDRHGIRFPEGWQTGEDQPFTALAYIHARRISVLASYDCVYWVHRDDGGNTTRRTKNAANPVRTTATMLALVAEHVPAGPKRDHLLRRHFQVGLSHGLVAIHREDHAPDRQRELFGRLHEAVVRRHSPSAVRPLPAYARLQYELVRRGLFAESMELVGHMRARWRALGPDHRPPGRHLVPAAVTVEGERVFAHYPYFRDPRLGIPDSAYDITDEVRFGTFVAPGSVAADWDPAHPGTLVVTGARGPGSPVAELRLVAARGGETVSAPVVGDGGEAGRFTGRIALPGPGSWKLALQVGDGPRLARPLPAAPALPDAHWAARGARWQARPHRGARHLRIRVGRTGRLRGLITKK